jgi:PAS domain S-box-containing protein
MAPLTRCFSSLTLRPEMSEAEQSDPIGLPPDLFRQAFPFFFALDRNLKLRDLGPSLQRVVPTLVPGADFTHVFHMLRCDDIPMTFEGLYGALEKRFVLIEHIASGLQLRGNFVMPPGGSTLIFLASPWFTDIKQMTAFGIGLNDFALHDPMVDLLMVRKDEQTARDDIGRLNKKLVMRFEQMQLLRDKLSLALEASRTSAWECDLSSGKVSFSPSWEEIVGTRSYREKKSLQTLFELVHEEDRASVVGEFTQCRNGLAQDMFLEYRVRRDDGTWCWIASRGKVIRPDERGRALVIAGVNIDITERKSVESKLRESQKLEAIGLLTGGLAHDFNNLLGIVVGNLDEIGERLPQGDARLRHQHRAALEAALRGAEVTRALLAVARRQPLELGTYDVNVLLAEFVPLARSSAGSAVTVRSDLAAGELRARVDAAGLSNVILNLVINARDAMQDAPGEHQITLRTRRVRIAPGADEALTPGGYALLEVADTGAGMSEQIRAQAFEPFFTTKERGHGTGLGLAMVHGYATQLGGTARIQTEPGRGTTVQLYLPMDAQAAVAAEAAEALRLAALQVHAILDTAPEAQFDALVAEAARICETPIALVSLVDEHRQWFKARVGLQASQTAREQAFCAHAIVDPGGVLVVPDATRDVRFSANPLVIGEPHVGFYAAVVLHDAAGEALGTLCVIDHVPRQLNAVQLGGLAALAERVAALIRARRPPRAATDVALPPVARTTTAPAPAPLGANQGKRVLVVDDEQALCELACDWLESLGYQTTGVHSPAAALERLAGEPFDILFTDIVMPGGMDGLALAREAKARHPHLRLVFTSGYARGLTNTPDLPGNLINKPYRKNDLAKSFPPPTPAVTERANSS